MSEPIEDDVERIKREVSKIKKEIQDLYIRLTKRKPFRDPRITFPRPLDSPSKLNQPLD